MGTITLSKSAAVGASATQPVKPEAGDWCGDLWDLPAFEDIQQEENARILQTLKDKLPGELLERPGLTDSLEAKIGESLSRHYHEIYNHYIASQKQGTDTGCVRYTADELAGLMRSSGGTGLFNTGEIEKNTVEADDLASHTDSLLRHKSDAAAFFSGDNAYSVVKCIFRDNALKPKNVIDAKIAVNIPDTDLIDSAFHHYALTKYLLKDLIAEYIINSIDTIIDGPEARETASADIDAFIEKITEAPAEIMPALVNPPTAGMDSIRSRGFNAAIGILVSVLEDSGLSYQFMENNKNTRELIIREYEDTGAANLPDEHFSIRLKYCEREELAEERKTYDERFGSFERQVQHLWDLVEVMYQDSRPVFKVNDFEDLAKKNKNRIKTLIKDTTGEPMYEGVPTMREGDSPRARLTKTRERISNLYEFLYPAERRIVEERLAVLEQEYTRFDAMINPHQIQSGLLIDLEITSIKRKKTTLDSTSRALNEFLGGVSKGFQNAAVAVLGRPKATLPAKASRRR